MSTNNLKATRQLIADLQKEIRTVHRAIPPLEQCEDQLRSYLEMTAKAHSRLIEYAALTINGAGTTNLMPPAALLTEFALGLAINTIGVDEIIKQAQPLRNAGRVWLLRQSNLSNAQIGNLLGLSKQRVGQIVKSLTLEGFTDLADELAAEDEQRITPADFADAIIKSTAKIASRMTEPVDPTIVNILKSATEYVTVAGNSIDTDPATAMNAIVLAESAIQLVDRLLPGDPAAVALAAPWMPKGEQQ